MLYSINKSNKDIAIHILKHAMVGNPNLAWMTGNKKLRLQKFYSFCLQIAMIYEGAYINSDNKGVLFFYKRGLHSTRYQKIQSIKSHIYFVFSAIKWSNLLKIYKLQKQIQKYTPKRPHLYCLIIAVDPNEKSTQTVIKLRDYLFEQSKKERLPIYVQTSVRRNKILFEKYGFVNYKKIENADYTLWLLKRDHEK